MEVSVLKITSLSFAIVGSLCIVMAALTAVGISPTFVEQSADFGVMATTTGFWGGLAVILNLSAIAFGVLAPKD
jgi:hypothetical protein